MPTDTQVNSLTINILTEAQYEQIQSPSSTELYLVPEIVDTVPTQDSPNTITSGAVYEALQNVLAAILPSQAGNAGKVLMTNGESVIWAIVNHDFAHQTNTTVSTSTHTVTFAANQRGSAMLTVSADLGLTIACNNGSDNYIWIKNTASAEVDITISSVTQNSTAVTNAYVPSDGISIPAGGLCEIGIVCNADGAFITTRNDLSL